MALLPYKLLRARACFACAAGDGINCLLELLDMIEVVSVDNSDSEQSSSLLFDSSLLVAACLSCCQTGHWGSAWCARRSSQRLTMVAECASIERKDELLMEEPV